MNKLSSNIQGIGFLVLAMLIFSLQDIAVKWIGGDYPVLEIVTFRSLIALPLTLLFFRFEGGRDCQPRNSTILIRPWFILLPFLYHALYGISGVAVGRNRRD